MISSEDLQRRLRRIAGSDNEYRAFYLLVQLRDEEHEGSWESLLTDMHERFPRLDGRRKARINADSERITLLKRVENRYGNLSSLPAPVRELYPSREPVLRGLKEDMQRRVIAVLTDPRYQKPATELLLTEEERLLISERDELHTGSWSALFHDLSDRLTQKPWNYNRHTRIAASLARICLMKPYEAQQQKKDAKFNLNQLVNPEVA